MLTYAIKMIFELITHLALDNRFPPFIEQAMDGTEVARHAAWSFDADERTHGPRHFLVVTFISVRGGNVLHDNMTDGAGGVGVSESRKDMRYLHAGLWVGV